MATPSWVGVHNGIVGDASSLMAPGDVSQFLGAHSVHYIYPGNPILTPNGTGGFPWFFVLGKSDVDQPFTMSGTSIGRVTLPLLAVGNGADLLVSICQDSSGVPGTVVGQTRVPASWITQLGAVSGIAQANYSPPILEYTDNPLATGQFNGFWMGASSFRLWSYPTNGAGGPTTSPVSTSYGNYFIQLGGNTGSTVYNNVYTIAFDVNGNLSPAVPQPALPVATDGTGGAAVTVDSSGNATLVFCGGQSGSGPSVTNAVFTASFDPATGTIASWSSQQSLPSAANFFGTAAYGSYIYLIGGGNGAETTTVWYAQVVNGQITQWKTASSIPVAQGYTYCMAVNGFLFAFGGFISSNLNTTYWAAINSDGSLGPWLTGPTLPVSAELSNGNAAVSLGNYGVYGNGSATLFTLGVSDTGPDLSWQSASFNEGGDFYAATEISAGQWRYYGLYPNEYWTMTVNLTPRISIPLPVSGLTNGTTYHVLLQQQGGDLNNYLRLHADFNTFPGNPVALSSNRLAYSWTAAFDNTSVPLEIYDNTVSAPNQWPLHTWEDTGSRITTVVRATTPDQTPIGILEATTVHPGQNSNSGFEVTLSPWTVNGGTAARSATQAFEGQWSAQVTPSGSASNVYIESELLATLPGEIIQIQGRVWLSAAVTSNFSMSINWYTNANAFLSTSSNPVTISAGVWSLVINTFTAPATAYKYTLAPTLSGTPAASNVFYIDVATAGPLHVGPQQSSVAELAYGAMWPNQPGPVLSITDLA
jgi:hypothetical protein